MALQTQFVSSFFTTNTPHSFSPILTIRSEKPSEPSDSIPKNPGVGFGPSTTKRKQQQKGQRERASSIIRRTPIEKPAFVSEQPVQQNSANENAFVIAWLGFGSVILVEGLALAASGLFPEEWDKFFVKYLYPSFTPTVFLFVAGAVVYGVLKYSQNEKATERK